MADIKIHVRDTGDAHCLYWEFSNRPFATFYHANSSREQCAQVCALIAAAPAMLAALKLAREVLWCAPMPYTSPSALRLIDKALDDAEGR